MYIQTAPVNATLALPGSMTPPAQLRFIPKPQQAVTSSERLNLRFGALSVADKQHIVTNAPVIFTDGADYRTLATSEQEATRMVRQLSLQALGQAEIAYHPKVKGPLAEGFGAAALVQTAPGQTVTLADSNINERIDIKICAEQNLMDQVVKHPQVRQADNPRTLLLSNILFNFENLRYNHCHLTPCTTCLDLFQSISLTRKDLLNPDTLVASIAVDHPPDEAPNYALEVRPMRALLPMAHQWEPSFPSQNIMTLPVHYSSGAQQLIQKRQAAPIDDAQIRETMQQALTGFAESAITGKSARNREYLGVGLMRYPDQTGATPHYSSGSSLHIKNSEPLYPELDALSRLMTVQPDTPEAEQLQASLNDPRLLETLTAPVKDSHLRNKNKMPPLQAGLAMVGFVHRQHDQPRPKLLGLLKDAVGGQPMLVGLIRPDGIHVMSSSDILPIQYKGHRTSILPPIPNTKAARLSRWQRFRASLRALLVKLFSLGRTTNS